MFIYFQCPAWICCGMEGKCTFFWRMMMVCTTWMNRSRYEHNIPQSYFFQYKNENIYLRGFDSQFWRFVIKLQKHSLFLKLTRITTIVLKIYWVTRQKKLRDFNSPIPTTNMFWHATIVRIMRDKKTALGSSAAQLDWTSDLFFWGPIFLRPSLIGSRFWF